MERTGTTESPALATLSTVGAGDSMVAGIVMGFVSGKTIADAVRYGVASGRTAVIRPGLGLCNPHNAERLFPLVAMAL